MANLTDSQFSYKLKANGNVIFASENRIFILGPRPLDVFLKAMPYRLLFGFVAAFLVWITPTLVTNPKAGLPFVYYILLLACYAVHQVSLSLTFNKS